MASPSEEQHTLAMCLNMLMESEQSGGSPEDTARVKKTVNMILNRTFGTEIPFVSSRGTFVEFEWLQSATEETLLDMEEELHHAGDEAGAATFKNALTEFFQLGKDQVVELEQEGAAFFLTFRNDYLLKHAERLFIEIAQIFDELGISSTPKPLNTSIGQIQSNSVYPLYTFLYDEASKERKRAIQSILQKYKLSVKDLKKWNRIKKKRKAPVFDSLTDEEMKMLFP